MTADPYSTSNYVPDPSDHFVAGRTAAIEGRDLIIEDAAAGDPAVLQTVTRVTIVESTRFWLGRVGAALSLTRPGQVVFARGTLMGATLTARQVWINITSVGGIVVQNDDSRLVVTNGTKEWFVELQPDTEYFIGDQSQVDVDMIPTQTPVQIVGLWDEQTRHIFATRVFQPAIGNSASRPPKPEPTS